MIVPRLKQWEKHVVYNERLRKQKAKETILLVISKQRRVRTSNNKKEKERKKNKQTTWLWSMFSKNETHLKKRKCVKSIL